MASFSNCVKVLLCGLSAATRNAIVALLNGYIGVLNAQVTTLTAELDVLNIASAPVALANSLVQSFINEVKAGANIIPFDLIDQCVEIGQLNEAIQVNLDIALVDADIIASDLERLLSFKDELTAEIADIQTTLELYVEAIATFDLCT